jgi:DNA-directed RNA polymerase subunit beta'
MYAHSRGTTLSLTDFDVDRKYRDDILLAELPKLKGKSKAKRTEGFNKITKLVQKAQDNALSANNNAYDMLNSGSLSKGGNVRQMISMPGVLTDVKGRPLDLPVLRSYAEGLDTGDYFNTHYAARKGTVDRAVNTQESGALNKSVLTVTRRLLIIETDCGTRKSITVELDDNNVLDRFIAETLPGVVRRNQLIDSEVLLKLKKTGKTEVEVRSPLTCESAQGLCQQCYGLLPNGNLASVGTNVGALDAHAVTERATQLTMQTFHTGGAATTGGVAESFPRLEQLLKVPQTLKGQAILSPVKGTVKEISKNLTGGFDVRIEGYGTRNDKTITIPSGKLPVVQKGSKVSPGDRLSEGSIKPQELGELKSHLIAQEYIVDQLDSIYDKKFYRKTFETVVRAMSDNAVVTDAPDNSGYIRGDKTSTSYLKSLNKDRRAQKLAPIGYKEYFKSVDTLNTDYNDFLTQFTTNRLKNALTTGAAKGNYANIRGKDPIPAYIYGEGFGKGDMAKGEFY